ncbi:MAG: type II toxin-antitoxin system HipA family toxin [Gammaproteobacteria bacterium]|nr:type II toxin-antitoxin system HipA family toxin [Gammaproteobacteria bacterium]
MVKHTRTLDIRMNGILIGKLEKTDKGALIFTYDQQWLKTPGARPISLSLPLAGKSFSGDVVYNFFDNLLPDNAEIRARIQTKFHVPTNHPFDLLASIGKDCVGAIQMINETSPTSIKEIKFETLNEKEIASIMRDYPHYPLGMTNNNDTFRISIAGAQEKSAFLWHKNKWCRPIGETPTTHIFKLPIGFIQHQQMDLRDSCENEWLCAQIAEAFGLPTAPCEILHFEDVKVLSVERFDRRLSRDKTWMMRLPQEDMCQALSTSPNLKYQADGGPGINNIMQLLLAAENPLKDRDIFFQSQVLFWLLAAIDGHAKNFSVFILPEGKFQLTPLYDIISAYPLIAKKQLQKQKIKMAMALRGENNHYIWHNIQRRHFIGSAKYARYSTEKAETILSEMLEKVETVIEQVSAKLPKEFPKHMSQSIFDGMHSMKQRLT